MAGDDLDQQPEQWSSIADQITAGVLKNLPLDKIRDMLVGHTVQGHHGVLSSILKLLQALSLEAGKTLAEIEEPVTSVFAPFVAPIVGSMFGTESSADLFASRGNREGRGNAARALVEAYMSALAGADDGEIEPGDEGAKRVATAGVHAAIEGWFNSWILEMLGECVPWEWLHFKELTAFPEEIIEALGIGNMTQRALRPLVDATARTPMRWATNKKYRPELLGATDIVRAFLRGDYDAGEASEELSRLGYSDKRQDVLLKNALAFPSPADLGVLRRAKVMDGEEVLANIRAQGYDDVGARQAALVEQIKHLNTIRDDSVAALRAAYVDRRLDDSQLRTYLTAIFDDDDEISSHVIAMQTMRGVNTKRLSPVEARACVKALVLPIAAYREALTLDGYDDEAVLSLELLLETELNADADVEKLRKQKEQERIDADAAKAAAAALKAADVAAARALARRGSLGDLARAVVRGLIPISRYQEVLDPQYDGDTVATLVGLVEQDRAAYVAQQQKLEDASKRAALRHIDVGQLQAAYLGGILTADQIRSQLKALQFADDDAAIIIATMQARKTDLDAAKKQRADAEAAAKRKSIDLGRFEQLVRRGHRTIGEYDGLLSALGFDEAARAGMTELLQLQIADDQAARETRAAIAAKNTAQGLSLDQIRRAVLLGTKTIDEFQTYLVQQKFTTDAQAVLVAELRNDVSQADAARRKRDEAAARVVETRVPVATVARAARLGIVSPAAYQQRLVDAGYAVDDVAIEMDLLAVEIADVQAARTQEAAPSTAPDARGLSLVEVERAVKAGIATIDDYRAAAVESGRSAAAVAVLVQLVQQELDARADAQARADAIDVELKPRNLSIAQLEAAVGGGLKSVDDFIAAVTGLGYSLDDAQLLATLLVDKLNAKGTNG
jgi:hypothetical protein